VDSSENSWLRPKNPALCAGPARGRQEPSQSPRKALISGHDSECRKKHFSYSFHALGIDPMSRGG